MDEYGTYGYDGYSTGAYETGTHVNFDSTTVAYAPGIAYDAYETQSHNAQQAYGAYDMPAGYDMHAGYDTGGYPVFHTYDTGTYETGTYVLGAQDTGVYATVPVASDAPEAACEAAECLVAGVDEAIEDRGEDVTSGPQPDAVVRQSTRSGRRRRTVRRSRRSTMLTVGVPSMAVMGVTAAAVSSVAAGHHDGATTQAGPTPTQARPTKLDQQLSDVSRNADDFADRAGRAQQRLDLKKRQAEEAKRKQAQVARKEAMRPKFVLPVSQRGLSAYFGQAGINWMSVHTGIDFPVSEGTPVMAATDGTVRTLWNPSYGNMAIVTAPDGTETWYCHLSSTKVRAGAVQAGTVIAYSGNTGNTTGPHLHFEVRPQGGEPIDPLPWLTEHGLDPR
ncbi:M23 family metallopeptidase [Streptomyces ferralitis]|uniref:M23 family metallopeptidase n=1 Tax=Streptantibioticus ferralitis TaxID=236510 RepID=A0ABT5Z2D1_9ACTN|nr:M23 family metallopeptidase [Streptantibioticus ferralitis]MDF2257928.1 M23 family metallopeptidase [Streptantibioticus ferralitis]